MVAQVNAIYVAQPLLVTVGFGLFFSHLTNRIIIATVCKVPYPTNQSVLLLLPGLFFLINPEGPGATIGTALGLRAELVPLWVVWYFVVLAALQYAHYVAVVTDQLARRLGIYVFSLGPRAAE